MPHTSTQLSELAARAIAALEQIDDAAPALENQTYMAQAATALEELAQILRGGRSGRDVLLHLLAASYPSEVSREVLRHASAIQEWPRRIRELRVQDGYRVESTSTGYRLLALEPDEGEAERWIALNEIRRRSGSAEARIKELLTSRVGSIVTLEELEYVSKISTTARRLRELRTEQGFRIESPKDNPDLRPGEYVLVDLAPIPAVERAVPAHLRMAVLQRDSYACIKCGSTADPAKRIWLEVDHIQPLVEDGANELENLRTLCNRCHDARRG